MLGLLGKKVGMTSFFTEDGRNVACTLVEVGPCVVTQIKTDDKEGYSAVQLGYDDRKEKNTPQSLKGHFKKAKTTPKRFVVEFPEFEQECELGQEISLSDVFNVGDFIDVTGTSKGKGFQGVVKRHNFSGVNDATHGQHNRQRHPGSIGAASYPSRVFKGMRMAGRTGNDRVRVENLVVLKLYPEKNLMLVTGSVPGAKNSYIIIEK